MSESSKTPGLTKRDTRKPEKEDDLPCTDPTPEEAETCDPDPNAMVLDEPQDSQGPRQKNHQISRSKTLNIVLLGQAGAGKSASGNTIMEGNPVFKSYRSSVPVTNKYQAEQRQMSGTDVRVIDTPDFFYHNVDTQSDAHFTKCKDYLSDEYVCLLVIKIGRFTKGKREILNQLEDAFDSKIREKTIVLFTHGEDLKNMNIEMFIQSDHHLEQIVELCGNRYHVFRNTDPDGHQVMELMEKICKVKGLEQCFPELNEAGRKQSNKTQDSQPKVNESKSCILQ
ncbi:GTPase IMAP family member 8 isoform X2 [Salmo salar]|uniref:GTPase IMAP family member 8 isoform X2 n=1 Tax=Salmo salar TaxID=8030 RepID=A0ABM3DBB9_SALSA|nr:GTPase IMAP family member 8-like isoform X2 [Salmo salar]